MEKELDMQEETGFESKIYNEKKIIFDTRHRVLGSKSELPNLKEVKMTLRWVLQK